MKKKIKKLQTCVKEVKFCTKEVLFIPITILRKRIGISRKQLRCLSLLQNTCCAFKQLALFLMSLPLNRRAISLLVSRKATSIIDSSTYTMSVYIYIYVCTCPDYASLRSLCMKFQCYPSEVKRAGSL